MRLGVPEASVLAALRELLDEGVISRVGPVFAPGTMGVSTLAAIAVPPERLHEVAEVVSGFHEVNHNYEREHPLNLWFVLAADSEERLETVLAAIEEQTCLPVHIFPLEEEFRIDLGFDLTAEHLKAR